MSDDLTDAQTAAVPDGYSQLNWSRGFGRQIGPLFEQGADPGEACLGFRVEEHHTNGLGNCHGGMLMSFADIGLSYISEDPGQPTASVTFTFEFAAPAKIGDLVECRGEVIRKTRSLIFAHGRLLVGDKVIVNCSTVEKIPGK